MASYYDVTVKGNSAEYRVVIPVLDEDGQEARLYGEFLQVVMNENRAQDYINGWQVIDGNKILHRKPKDAMTIEQFRGAIF